MVRAASSDLVIITLRLRVVDVRRARAEAKKMAIPYQHVIRGWVATAAERKRSR